MFSSVGTLTVSVLISSYLVGEAYSSPEAETPITAGYRMFTVENSKAVCAVSPIPTALSAAPIMIGLGESFGLSELVITALDGEGNVLPNVPLIIEYVEDVSPVLEPDNGAADVSFIGRSPGKVLFRAGLYCQSSEHLQAEFWVTVVDESNSS